jgi:tRNA pseudouridine55 synthase
LTSHDVVARVRTVLDTSRVGHAGTLDPLATGLLVIAVGSATRLLRFAQVETKHYLARVRFGEATDSLDADGHVVASTDDVLRPLDLVRATAEGFLGASFQRPPMVSAIKVKGRRLHELARQGVEVERPERPIEVTRFEVRETPDPREWDLDIECSTGTYVRVLGADLAERLGTLGHLVALRRLRSGAHDVTEAVTLEFLEQCDDARGQMRLAGDLLAGLESVVLDEIQTVAMRRGQRLRLEAKSAGPLAAYDSAGELVGVLAAREELWQPDVVLVGVNA